MLLPLEAQMPGQEQQLPPLLRAWGWMVTLQSNSIGWWLEATGQRPEGNVVQLHTWSLLLCCFFVCPGVLSRSVAHLQCVDSVCSRELLHPVPLWDLASVSADCRSCSPEGTSRAAYLPWPTANTLTRHWKQVGDQGTGYQEVNTSGSGLLSNLDRCLGHRYVVREPQIKKIVVIRPLGPDTGRKWGRGGL